MTPAILLIRNAGISHEVLSYPHDPSAESFGKEAAELLGLDPATVFKTLIVDVDGVGLCCAVVPVHRMLDLKAIADAVGGRKAKMAEQGAAERATGYIVGGISPLAQKKMLPLVLDVSAMEQPTIHVSAGRRGLEIALAPHDLLALTRGQSATIARD